MKKSDLENGMIVEDRKGEKYIVIKKITNKSSNATGCCDLFLNICFGCFDVFDNFEEDLTNKNNNIFDIVKVYYLECCGSEKDELILLWERKDNISIIRKQINTLCKFYKIKDSYISKEDDEYKILISLNEGVEVETYLSDETIEGKDECYIYRCIESSIRSSIRRQYFKNEKNK